MPAAAPRPGPLPWNEIRAHFEEVSARYPDLSTKVVVIDRWPDTDRQTDTDHQPATKNGKNEWPFVMISPAQNHAVIAWLLDHSSRPNKAVRLWSLLFGHLDRDTGEITLTRDQMAEQIGEEPSNVSRIMSELEGIGAISRQRLKVAGMRGPGVVRYFMNPNIATHLPEKRRGVAQAKAPKLTLVSAK